MRSFTLLLCGFLSFSAVSTSGQSRTAPAGATIEGVVRRAGTDDPVAGAQVALISRDEKAQLSWSCCSDGTYYLYRPDTASSAASAKPGLMDEMATNSGYTTTTIDTDEGGRFVFRDLAPGQYRLAFSSDGYVSSEHGTPLTLAAGQALRNIEASLTPAGNIEGHVGEVGGEPVVHVPIFLWRYMYSAGGRKTVQAVASALTDDRGDYRIFWIAPGRYHLSAGGPLIDAPVWPRPVERAQVFYPNAVEFDKAETIEVLPGSERTVDWMLPARQSLHIRARLVDSRTGTAPKDPWITVSPKGMLTEDSSIRGLLNRRGTEDRFHYDPRTGLLEVDDLPGGAYEIRVDSPRDGEDKPPTVSVVTSVRITDDHVEDIVLDMADTSPTRFQPLRGRIRIEGGSLPPAKEVVVRFNASSDAIESHEFPVNPHAEFTIPVTRDPGDAKSITHGGLYRVSVNNLPNGWYVEAATVNGSDVLNTAAPFSPSAELEITVRPGAGRIDGVLRDTAGQVAPRMDLILIPNRGRDRTDRYSKATADEMGRFSFENVWPGDYTVYAWQSLEAHTYFDPDVMRRFEGKGAPVRVVGSAAPSLDVTLIPAGVAK